MKITKDKIAELKANQPLKLYTYDRLELQDIEDNRFRVRADQYSSYYFDFNEISESNMTIIVDNLDRWVKEEVRIFIELRQMDNKYYMNSMKVIIEELITNAHILRSAKDIDIVEVNYIPYLIGNSNFYVQRDGIFTLCGTSGTGKTYSAIANLNQLDALFDEILYLNWEITDSDIMRRIKDQESKSRGRIKTGKLNIWGEQNIHRILEYIGNKNIAIIVDNIDNLIGVGDNPFDAQHEFIKLLDAHIKRNNQHCLLLTQHTKENIRIFDAKGSFTYEVNQNIISGVKQLPNMSRSVTFMSVWEGPKGYEYKAKYVKKGSGLFDKEYIERRTSRKV